MFVFENDGHRRPEELRHLGVVPRIGVWLHEDAVVADGDAALEGIVRYGEAAAGGVVSREVVGYAELRTAEVAQVEVYHAFLCLDAPCVPVYGRCHDGMSLAPHAVVAYVDKGDMRLTVVSLGHGADESLDLGEEYGVVVFGLLVVAVDVVSRGSSLEDPFGVAL